MSIASTFPVTNSKYYTPEFQQVLADHKTFLLRSKKTTIYSVDQQMLKKSGNDLSRLLKEMNVPPQYHGAVLCINGITNPNNAPADLLTLAIPDGGEVDRLFNISNAVKGVVF